MRHHTLLSACLRAGFCLALLLSAQVLFGQTEKTIILSYNEKDFVYRCDENGRLQISSNKLSSVYNTDPLSFALPYIPVHVLIKMEENFVDFTFNTINKTIRRNVTLGYVPLLSSINKIPLKEQIESDIDSTKKIENVKYMGTHIYGNYKVLSFRICPYKYDSTTHSLVFLEKIKLDIHLSNIEQESLYGITTASSNKKGVNMLMEDLVRGMVVNSYEMDSINPENQNYTEHNRTQNNWDYIIVTSSSLASSFQPLADWKTKKGIRTKVVSTSEIYETYSDSISDQLKIKYFLKDYYDNYGLKYVLLGGDDTIVPTQECCGYVFSLATLILELHIPTDYFYATFGGQFDWNANGNNLCGEDSIDGVDLTPSIFISRAPVRTTTDVNVFVNKVLNYEQTPPIQNWNNNMLMFDVCLGKMYPSSTDSICDTYYKGKAVYDNYISPYWNGTLTQLYETKSTTQSNSSGLSSQRLQSELSLGYPFVDVMTHGGQDRWHMPENLYYTSSEATACQNSWPTIITTIACSTNAFTSSDNLFSYYPYDPCLSEAFIRNPNSGVIAYLGGTRPSLVYFSSDIDPTTRYDAEFYKILFSDSLYEKNFGRIVTAMKMNLVDAYNSDVTNWVQYGFSPMGDPEMPIFTSKPKTFDNVKLLWSESSLMVRTEVGHRRICVMSLPDNGESYYQAIPPSTGEVRFYNLPDSFSICITAQGYVPYVRNMSKNDIVRYIQNKTITQDTEFSGITIDIGSDVTDEIAHGPVTINNGSVIIDGTQGVTIKNDFEINTGASLIINDY